jgi:hypothetical protein
LNFQYRQFLFIAMASDTHEGDGCKRSALTTPSNQIFIKPSDENIMSEIVWGIAAALMTPDRKF